MEIYLNKIELKTF
ncbi:UNVERIFIED_CONTAM: hypothetical protein GTU68_039855 [Idotea baltica]|nr:hypothetical protein [Idotea baltica]